MLGICLQILSILGIILLALLALAVAVLFLVLFFPVTYCVAGEKKEEGICVRARAKWLFGLLRVTYQYPEPGRVVARALWIKLYDARMPAGEGAVGDSSAKQKEKKKKGGRRAAETKSESERESGTAEENISPKESPSAAEERADTAAEMVNVSADRESLSSPETENAARKGKISQKIEKIKYTICSIYDKIKRIWENIIYYIELLQEEDTKRLFSDVWRRVCKILKNIRPRRLKADVLFGAPSPDTTGYLYGAYCMASSAWGHGLVVTPDFERAVLEAEFDVSGHITVWVLLVNLLKLFLDRRLRRFIRKMKAGKKNGLAA